MDPRRIFFSGIGGSGLSAIAGFTALRGFSVSGSDRLFDSNPGNRISGLLKSLGIKIFPQDGSGLDKPQDLVIFSTAVEKDNPDLIRAVEKRIPLMSRPQYLADLVSGFSTIAVAGTSGKSTVSGMLAFLMQELGMDPNFLGGGRVKHFRSALNAGNYLAGGSHTLIVEACESDGSIVHYKPVYSVILNLDLDHHPVDETAVMFERLHENTSGRVVVGADDPNLMSLGFRNTRTFSIDRESDYKATDVEYSPRETVFRVKGVKFRTLLPGRHNLYNSLACIALLSEMDLPLGRIAKKLPEFRGIERRFDVHLDDDRYLVLDDYAHNPHKIASLMHTLKQMSKRICYIFQPHGFGPVRLMKDGYIDVFSRNLREGDILILLPIYYAGGTASRDISSRDLAEGISSSGRVVVAVNDRSEIFGLLPGGWDSFAVFGARDDSLSCLTEEIAKQLRSRPSQLQEFH